MNIINKVFLKLALSPSGLYRSMGVSIPHLKAILYTKLTIDDRRPNTIQQTRRSRQKKQVSLATVGTMLISALLGLIYLFSFSIGVNMITHLTFYFSMFFFMLSATLISDFTSVLIDVRDNYIILPKPISDSTFIVARLLHIFIHICKLVLPMCIPALFIIGPDSGLAGSVYFLLVVLLVTLFTIFFINALYIIILKVTTPQKFQSIISYIQILLAVLIYASYQIIPKMMIRLNMQEMDISMKKSILFYPIYWFASSWNVLYTMHGTSKEIIAAALGIVVPLLSLFIVIRYLAPSFNNKLAMIGSGSSDTPKKNASVTSKQGTSYSSFVARIFTRTATERTGFLFAWKMSARSRDFKMKVYPSIGYLFVYVIIMFMNNRHLDFQQIQEQGTEGKIIILSALYFTSFLLVMAINQIIYSEQYKASWIYYVTPVKKPGEIIAGAAKAAIIKFYFPIVAFITIAGIAIVGLKVLPNIILGLFNELLIATIIVYASNKMFPFSIPQNNNVKTGSFLRSISIVIVSGIIGGVHYFIYDNAAAVILCALLSITATWLLMSSVKNTTWEAIKSSYSD